MFSCACGSTLHPRATPCASFGTLRTAATKAVKLDSKVAEGKAVGRYRERHSVMGEVKGELDGRVRVAWKVCGGAEKREERDAYTSFPSWNFLCASRDVHS
jgi:hypothetical protein